MGLCLLTLLQETVTQAAGGVAKIAREPKHIGAKERMERYNMQCLVRSRLLQGGPPASYKWSYKPYKWPYKWATGVITLLIGVITPFITSRGPTLKHFLFSPPIWGR